MSTDNIKTLVKPFGNIVLDSDIYYRLYCIKEKPRPYHMFKSISGLGFLKNYIICSFAKKNKRRSLSRLLLCTDRNYWVDHINRNPLDNRRANLRAVNPRQNCLNRKVTNNTGFFGVSVYKSLCVGKFKSKTGKRLFFSAPDTPNNRVLCAFARDKFVLQNGDEEYAPLNFPCWKFEPFRSILISEDLYAYKEKRQRSGCVKAKTLKEKNLRKRQPLLFSDLF